MSVKRRWERGFRLQPALTLALVILLSLGTRFAAAQGFTAIDLGTLGGATSGADGIGASGASVPGVVVGSATDADDKTHGFAWKDADNDGVVDAGEMVDLGTVGTGDTSSATAANASGWIVGYAKVDDTDTHAILWKDGNSDGDYGDDGEKIDLGTLKDSNAGSSSAMAINASGQIVGYSDTNGGDIHAVLWEDKNSDGDYGDDGEKIDLGTLVSMDAGDSHANAINDDGRIAGWSETTDGGDRHAVLWTDANGDGDYADTDETTDLGTLAASDAGDSEAYAISKTGDVVGLSEITDGGNKHAFLYSGGGMIDLGTLGGNASEAYGINSVGQVVGRAQKSGSMTYYAFLYSDGVMYDLNIVGGTTGLTAATAINDALQIVGDGNDGTDDYAFRVSPQAPVSAITLKAESAKGGKAIGGTITLGSAAPAGGATVNLTSNKDAAIVPASVLVPEGKTTANFSVTTAAVATNTTATITASRGLAKSASLTVSAAAVSKLAVKPSSLAGGATATGTVTLDGAAPAGGATVTLLSDDEDTATVPATVTVAAGKTSATFTLETEVVTETKSATISAAIGAGTPATAAVSVTSSLVSAVTIAPASLAGGKLAIGTVTLTGAAPTGGTTVTLTSSSTDTATVPATVKVPAGKTSTTFAIKSKVVSADASVTVEGKTGDSDAKTGKLKVLAPALSSLVLTKSSVTGGGSLKGIVTLTGRTGADLTVTLSDGSAAATDPGTEVVVKAGATSATFDISTTTVTADTKVTLKATLGKISKSAALTVKK